MTVTPTPNKGFLQITIGTESGTWGPFVNATTGMLDNILGTTTVLPLTNSNVVLSSAQYQCGVIQLTGSLSANLTVVLPAVGSFYTVQNMTGNSSSYQVTFATASFGQVIGIPWGESIDIMTDGPNVKFRNFGRIGTYIDIAYNAVPAWISHCTVPPYLLCDGSAFSSAVYPVLADLLKGTILASSGGNFLPDCLGRTRLSLDDNSGTVPNFPGNLMGFGGGAQDINAVNLNTAPIAVNLSAGNYIGATNASGAWVFGSLDLTSVAKTPNMPPYVVTGITMIRAG